MTKPKPIPGVSREVAAEGETSKKIKLTDVAGRLDEFDFRVIDELIELYDKTFPYPHAASIDKLAGDIRRKRKREQSGYNDFNELSKETQMRHTLSIPQGLLVVIKQAYPNIIRDPVQYRQFQRRYKRFNTAERY